MDREPAHIDSLPLSWQYSPGNKIFIKKKLLTASQKWLVTFKTDFPGFYNFLREIKSNSDNNYLIRGCNKDLSLYLANFSFDKIIFGKEAVLEFSKDHFSKKSLQVLVTRGLKKGNVIEVNRNSNTIEQLRVLRKSSAHGKEPQLKHLFLTKFEEETRLFVFAEKSGNWLAGILVSVNSPDKFHTELLLRHNHAHVGVMEALVFKTFQILKQDDKKEFSLGEVPFVVNIPITKSFYRDFILNRVAKFFRFAYNYEGLYNFKNKFNPRWDHVYICEYPKLKLSHIGGIIIKSNLLRLIFYKVIKR